MQLFSKVRLPPERAYAVVKEYGDGKLIGGRKEAVV